MKPRPFEALERNRDRLLKTIAELRAGQLRGIAEEDVPQLIADMQKRIETIDREMGDSRP